jgi:hypothetical protein
MTGMDHGVVVRIKQTRHSLERDQRGLKVMDVRDFVSTNRQSPEAID